MRDLVLKICLTLSVVTFTSGCADVLQDILGQRKVRRSSTTIADDIRWLSLEDPSCVQAGVSLPITSVTAYIWDRDQITAAKVPFETTSSEDGRLSSKNIVGAILGVEGAESCTVSDKNDISCESMSTGKEDGAGLLKVCRSDGTYKRDSIEAMTLTAQYLAQESFKFYNAISGKKEGLLPAQIISQYKLRQEYKLSNGSVKTTYLADNAAFQPGESNDLPVSFHLFPTSKSEFTNTGLNLWEVPFVVRHEFAHHIFDHYTGDATGEAGITQKLHFSRKNHSILPRGEGRPIGVALSSAEVAVQAVNGINETFADLYAYFEAGAVPDQIKGVNCLDISRDPSSPTTAAGSPKGLTPSQVSIYEGKADAVPYINCFEPTYDDEHDIATALGYPLAQFIKVANSGASATDQAKILLMWATRMNNLIDTSPDSVSVDTLVRELVLTLKTDASKSVGSACIELKRQITGLPLATAACQ